MVAVIKGDIISSRSFTNQKVWLVPLKSLLKEWGESPYTWELAWGDMFQIEVENVQEALWKAFQIKALLKGIDASDANSNKGGIDVRLSIGIGDKTYSGSRVSESNGPAFVYTGEQFDLLERENMSIAIKSPWELFNREMNLFLKFATKIMDSWSISSAELAQLILKDPNLTQVEISRKLNITQSSVSSRWKRSSLQELLELESLYRFKLKKQMNDSSY
jgi:hypothetical protein